MLQLVSKLPEAEQSGQELTAQPARLACTLPGIKGRTLLCNPQPVGCTEYWKKEPILITNLHIAFSAHTWVKRLWMHASLGINKIFHEDGFLIWCSMDATKLDGCITHVLSSLHHMTHELKTVFTSWSLHTDLHIYISKNTICVIPIPTYRLKPSSCQAVQLHLGRIHQM